MLAQCVSDCNTLLAPMLPHSANVVAAVFGATEQFMPMPRVEEVADLDVDARYPIITGDYSATPPWRRVPVVAGTVIDKPAGVFTKLDDSVIAQELDRMAG